MSSKGDAILVFSKGSEPHKVKTRLHPFVTPSARFDLHIAFLMDTLEKIKSLSCPAYLYVAGNSDLPFQCDLPIYPQEGSDLGARLANAFDSVLKKHDRAVVIGTDSPDLPVERIELAFAKLNETDVVLGPTDDGGYYLLGLSRMLPEIFENISWSTDKVFQQTVQRARNHRVHVLEPHYDVDVIEDLFRLQKNLDRNAMIAPHTKQWFLRNKK